MFHHLHSRFPVSRCSGNCIIKTVLPSTTTPPPHFQFLLQNSISQLIRFVSSATISDSNQLCTLEYLVKSCGLSPESALKACQSLILKPQTTTTKPDSVISLFKTYGFTQPQISKLISSNPLLLLADPENTLKPKLDFFNSIRISGPILGNILSKDTNFLQLSLEKQIIPSINFLKTLGLTDSSIAVSLNRGGWMLHNAERKMGPNIAILREVGIPESNILKFVMGQPYCLRHDSERFNEIVLQVKKLGLDSSSMIFCRGLHILLGSTKARWDAKMEVYKSFCWSEDEVLSVFKKQPNIMAPSVKKISSALDFFMNELKWTRGDIATTPVVISLSLEKRVIPRCYVLLILISKGLVKKQSIGAALKKREDVFLKKFVIMYQDELPNLLKTYRSKVGT